MKLYDRTEQCCGCRACEQICPVNCISMEKDCEGFAYPVIDESRCIKCNLCQRVCMEIENQRQQKQNIYAYAAKSKDEEIRKNSSSGGVFYELGQMIIHRGGVVYGAVFDKSYGVSHQCASTLTELRKMCGSKYTQSDVGHTYTETQKLLQMGTVVLYSGTPCQIAGLKSFLQSEYDNLICVSIVCHGVCSPLVWEKYVQDKSACGEICDINFRDKVSGWHNYSFSVQYEQGDETEKHNKNLYMQGFLQDLYLRPSCYRCRAKVGGGKADIILGDYWGIEKYHFEFDDDKGVSAVLLCTEKGKATFEDVSNKLEVLPSIYEYIEKENPALAGSVAKNSRRERFFRELVGSNDIKGCIRNNLKAPITDKERFWYMYPTVMQYLKLKISGYHISDFFVSQGYYKIVLYAITDLTGLLYDDLVQQSQGTLTEILICDKNYTMYENGFKGKSVMGIEQLVEKCKNGQVDCVVVCNVLMENTIIGELLTKGCSQESTLSINSILYSMGD